MSILPSSSALAACQQKQRRLAKLKRSRALYAIALLIPLGVLQLRSQNLFTGVMRNETLNDGTETPVQEFSTANENAIPLGQGQNSQDDFSSAPPFNYTAFWEAAMETALQSLQSEHKENPSPCPKVYVYDLPPSLIDETDKSTGFGGQVTLKGDDEKIFRDYLHKTHQYSFPSILEYRLRTSKLCRTHDPDQADLFFAPLLPASKSIDEYAASCKGVTGEMLRSALTHLNSSNACRHFVAVGKGHVDVQHCDGWFSNPIPELVPISRLAYSNYSFVLDSHGAHRYDPHDTTNATYPNLVSVPYPSSLHFRKSQSNLKHLEQDYARTKRKAVLMNFVGKYNHGDVEVRERIHNMCTAYKDENICEFVPKYHAKSMPKARTTFCLEPAGDTPGRKSLSDSITFGCIPVLFSELTDDVAPWFWLDWKDRARVVVPREEFVAGRIDLKTLLEGMPPKLLDLMQVTLRDKSRRFQYSLDDDQEDGVRVILDNLHRQALDRESRGECGY